MDSTLTSPFRPPEAQAPAVNGGRPAEPRAEVVTVTPAMAQEWAERNTRNRPVRYARVARFARDMAAGNWTLNGESVKFDINGDVLDGQHRIYACIQAEVPFQSLVVTGLPPETQDTIDTGAARTMADQITLRGESRGPLLAAVTRAAYLWLHGARGGKGHSAATADPTHSELLALLEAVPLLRDATMWADKVRLMFRPVKPSVYGLAWLVFHGIDHIAAEVFLEGVVTGADLSKGHPALAFRNRMLAAWDTRERIGAHEQFACLILAWNAWREGRELVRLQLPKGGLTPKNFPEPK